MATWSDCCLRSGKTATCTMGLLVLRSSRGKRLERHGLTLQAPLAALSGCSAAPLSRAEDTTAVFTDPALKPYTYSERYCDTPFRGESRAGGTRLGPQVAGIRLWLATCAREDLRGSKKRFCHVIFSAGSVVPPAPRPKQTRRNDDLQLQSNAKTACAKRITDRLLNHISISAGSLHLDRLAPPRW
jgi:hypothetical protein